VVLHGVATVDGDGAGSDSGTGRVRAVFDDIPDLPWTNLTVVMNTGNRALMTNPASCGTHNVSVDFTPNTTGGSVVTDADSFTTSYDGLGGACPGTDPFDPTFDVSVSNTAAGAHPNVTLEVDRADKRRKLRKLKFSLPVGFAGSAAAAPTCTQVDADAGNCAVGTQVGQVAVDVGSGAEGYTLNGTIHNTVAPVGAPAKMTAILPVVVGPYDFGKVIVPINVSLRSDLGIDAETGNLPLRHEGIPVRVRSMATTLNGMVGSNAFITNPSKCQVNTFTATMTPESGSDVVATDSFTTTGCPASFDASLTAAVDTSEYGQPAGLTIGVNVPADKSTLKRLQLTMPSGMEINPAVGNGLATCSAANIDAGGGSCPAASEMGTVSLTTPLLASAQSGKVYLEDPGVGPANRYKLGVVIDLPGQRIVLHGSAQVDGNGSGTDAGTGRVTTDFDGLPDLPFSNLTVALRTGDRALLTNPTSCGSHTVSADLTPNTTGGATITRTGSFTTSYDGAGASCPGNDPLAPTVDVELRPNLLTPAPLHNRAGQHPDVRITVTRPDKHETIRSLMIRLPNGFTGSPTAAPTCPQAVADAGACTDDTKIGTVAVSVGSGAETFTATGKLFNTVPPSNRPAKLTAVIPVVVGPYDLGQIITPIDTTLDGNTFQLTAEAANLPLRHEGIPIRIRQMQIDLDGWADQDTIPPADDKPFITNPHQCGNHDVFADVTSPRPQTVTVSDTITIDAVSCPTQFNPGPILTVDNANTAAGEPTALDVQVNMGPANDATVKTVSMPLPSDFKLNPGSAANVAACTAAQLDADTCPANSKVGTASLNTTLLTNVLNGDVYLETPGTTEADRYKLAVRLRGAVDITIRGVAQVNETTGDITAEFDDLPDIPFTTFTMNLTGYNDGSGAVPMIVNPPDTCGARTVTATLTPYGGGSNVAPTDTVNVTGCPGSHPFTPTFDVSLSTTASGANPDATFNITRADGEQDIRDVKVSLPPGFMGSAAAVPLCSRANAQSGNCAAASKIGTVAVDVGYGSDLLTVNGDVFLVDEDPNNPNDLAGMAIRLPAIAGPYDLGLVNILGAVTLRTTSDHGIDTEFEDIPKAFKGVPVPVRDMTLTINGTVGGKPMLYNASSCAAADFDAAFTSHDAGTATGNESYGATGCARSFQPTLHAQATGGTAKIAPTWDLTLTMPPGNSTLKNMTAVLPPVMSYNAGIPIQNQCHQAQIDAQACPQNSKYGTVTVNTPLLPYPVTGDVFIGDPAPGVQLIRVIIKIGPPINLQLVGINDLVGGSIVSTFSNIPDLIWSDMTMHFPGGDQGLIKANAKGACQATSAGSATSHGGQSASVTTTVAGTPEGTCGTEPPECKNPVVKVGTKGMKKGSPKNAQFSLSFSFASDDCYTLNEFQVRLPKGSKVNKKLLKKYIKGKAGDRTLTGKDFQSRGKDGIRVLNLKKFNAQSISFTSKKGAITIPSKLLCANLKGKALKKCGKKLLKFRFVYAKNGVPVAKDIYISSLTKSFK
jgi:hypothetical protein